MQMNKNLLIMAVIVFTLYPSYALIPGFDFTQNVTLDFSFDHSTYSMPLVVDTLTLINEGKLQSDCQDLRFTTLSETLFNYWIEKDCNTTTTLAYFTINESITAGNNTYAMHYGNSSVASASNFNETFSNILIINGDFEGDVTGDPDDWTISEASGNIDVTQARAFTGTNSTFYVDNSGAGQPTMIRSFSGTSVTNIFEFMINVDLISGASGPFVSMGANTGDFDILSMRFDDNGSIAIFPDNVETILNETFTEDEWVKVQIGINFTNDKKDIWINDSYAGQHNFRNLGGSPSNLDDVGFRGGTPTQTSYYVDAIRIREWETPEPTAFFGPEESEEPLILVANTTTPNIFDVVEFNATSENTTNFTQFWWDFGDATAIINTLINTTTHQYAGGGIFNATVTALNESGVNFTDSLIITVFEPQITIFAKDTVNNILLDDFTVNASNSTSSFEFSSVGFNATWNYTSGPVGNVSILVMKNGFNSTMESINVNTSANVNFTASLVPATLLVYDSTLENFPTVRGLPSRITVSNVSNQLVKSPEFEVVCNNVTSAGSPDTVTCLSPVGTLFRYQFGYISGTVGTCDFVQNLCDSDGANCQLIENLIGLACDAAIPTKNVLIDTDGTYSMRFNNGTQFSSGSFSLFPATLKSELTTSLSSSEIDQSMITIPHFAESVTSGMPVGNLTITVERETDGLFGFYQTYSSRTYFVSDFTNNSLVNFTAYSLFTDESKEVLFNVQDLSSSAIADVLVEVRRFINGTQELVTSGRTDGTGLLTINLDPDGEYQITFSKSGFVPQLIDVVTPQDTYTITLSGEFGFFQTVASGLTVLFQPINDFIFVGQVNSYNVTVVDSTNNLDSVNFSLIRFDGVVLNTSFASGNPSGQIINFVYTPIVNDSLITATAEIIRLNADEFDISKRYPVWNTNSSNTTIDQAIVDMRDEFDAKSWSILVLVIAAVASIKSPVGGLFVLWLFAVLGTIDLSVAMASSMVWVGFVLGGSFVRGNL